MRRKTFENHTSKPKQPMESVHMDICGLMSTVTYGGGRYFLLLGEAASRYSKAVIISDRSSPLVVKETINLIRAIEKANGKIKVKKVLSDNALEFRSCQLINELNKRGIQKITLVAIHHSRTG
jgi:hypothetical protein